MKITHEDLKAILPHAYPFLLIDRVEEVKVNESLIATKSFTASEWVFANSRFPVDHVPETLLIEAAAQAALVLYAQGAEVPKGIKYLGKFKAEFSGTASIGDQVRMAVRVVKTTSYMGIFEAQFQCRSNTIGNVELICGIKKNA